MAVELRGVHWWAVWWRAIRRTGGGVDSALVINCTVAGNVAPFDSNLSAGMGGGVYACTALILLLSKIQPVGAGATIISATLGWTPLHVSRPRR